MWDDIGVASQLLGLTLSLCLNPFGFGTENVCPPALHARAWKVIEEETRVSD